MACVTAARAAWIFAVVLACTGREVAPGPTPSTARAEVAGSEDAAPSVVVPAELPEPPAPTAPLPPGAPDGEGAARVVLALDDQRALVELSIPEAARGEGGWLTLMRRDGSLEWARPFPHVLAVAGGREAVVRVGDVVSLSTWERRGEERRLVLRGLSLVDGSTRFTADLGAGLPDSTTSDGAIRVDTTLRSGSGGRDEDAGELVVSSATGVVWRASIGRPVRAGHEPTVIGDLIVARAWASRAPGILWTAFDRRTGARRTELLARAQSCSDGARWFLLDAEGLLEVDAATLQSRRVAAATVTLPGASEPWALEDCVFAGEAPVVLVARERRRALVALDPGTLAIAGHVELGEVFVGDGVDALPARARRVVVLKVATDDHVELVAADPQAGELLGRWRPRGPSVDFGALDAWSGGLAFRTHHTIAVVAGDTGAMSGRAVLVDRSLRSTRYPIGGDALWVLPSPIVIGRRAPRVVSLVGAVPDAVRDAVLRDVVGVAPAEGAE